MDTAIPKWTVGCRRRGTKVGKLKTHKKLPDSALAFEELEKELAKAGYPYKSK
jgi:hypothetical protein